MNLHEAILQFDDVQLFQYLQEEIENKGNHEEVMKICEFEHQFVSSLQLALIHEKSIEVINKLIDIGRKELVMMINSNFRHLNVLQYECNHKNASIGVISKLLEVGGKDLIMVNSKYVGTALHNLCENENVLIDLISKFLEVGGKELVMMKNSRYGLTALHNACRNEHHISIDIISLLLDVGGKDLVMIENRYGETALHLVCQNEDLSIGIISKLLEFGGNDLVMMKTAHRNVTALHLVCQNENVSTDIISKLLEVGGKELMMEENLFKHIALHSGYFFNELVSSTNCMFNDAFAFMVKEGILADIGGEFGIGGLFNSARKEVQNKIYEKWYQIAPALESTVASLQEEQILPPILHAAILDNAPLNIIQDIINRFDYTLLKVDSFNRIPIEVAVDKCLSWSDGMQDIVEATTLAQHNCSSIYVAAKYGLKWNNHMKELVTEENADEIIDGHDNVTGLRLFMSAAVGSRYDLSAIYSMMKMVPDQIVDFDDCSDKRKKLE